jgi:phosphate transport system permease protein
MSILAGRPAHGDAAFRWLAIASAALVLLILGLIAVVMGKQSTPVLHVMGPAFIWSRRWSPADSAYGALPFMWGTLYTALIALVAAVPVSLGVALFITEVVPLGLKRPLIYFVDLLAVVPSVVFGLWGILMLTPYFGRSFFTAGLILGMMITPIVTSLSREVIETTPAAQKEGALALGATRWEMIWGSIWPHSKGGLLGAVMLGLGRAMGETIAAALTIGSAIGQMSINPLMPGNSMPAVIANQWGEAFELQKSALIALAMLLFAITITVNLIATAIVQRSTPSIGAA